MKKSELKQIIKEEFKESISIEEEAKQIIDLWVKHGYPKEDLHMTRYLNAAIKNYENLHNIKVSAGVKDFIRNIKI